MVENFIFCLEVAQKCENIKSSRNSCLPKLSTRSSFSSPKNEYPGRFLSPKSAYPGFLDLKTPYPGHYLVGNGLGTGFRDPRIPGTHFWETRNGLGTHFFGDEKLDQVLNFGRQLLRENLIFLLFIAKKLNFQP